MPSATEIKAVVTVLEGDIPEGATSKDVALLAIEALDKVREAADKWVMVARIKLPGGEWHNFALGPFTTLKKAQDAGERFMPTSMVYKRDGDGSFRAVPLVNRDREAWEAVRPEHENDKAFIAETVKSWHANAWSDIVHEKSGWHHPTKAAPKERGGKEEV